MGPIRISESFTLPESISTSTILDVGKRGSGKSSTARRLVEQLHAAGIPFVVLDPVDTWFGLKSSRTGKRAGLAGVYVFGGEHQDLPLEGTSEAGALIADAVCESRLSAVLSVKHLSNNARSLFMAAFASTIFRKWKGGRLHLVLEEAHELAPQQPPKGENAEKMLGEFKRLWKLGRSSGIGGTAITQRPAALHKDITTQAEVLIVHRLIGPQDVEAVRQWIKYHGQQAEAVLAQLASLPTGEAFVWAPDFPEDKPLGLKRAKILEPETFDSSATPTGTGGRDEIKLAEVDVERLSASIKASVEKAKEDDPKALRRKVADLEALLRKKEAVLAEVDVRSKAIEAKLAKVKPVEVVKTADVARLERAVEKMRDGAVVLLKRHAEQIDALSQRMQVVVTEAGTLRDMVARVLVAPKLHGGERVEPFVGSARTLRNVLEPGHRDRGRGEPVVDWRPKPGDERPVGAAGEDFDDGDSAYDRITRALALHPDGIDERKLAVLSRVKRGGSSWRGALARGRNASLIERGGLRLTDAGRRHFANVAPLPTGWDLVKLWQRKLGDDGAAGRVLNALVKLEASGSAPDPEQVARDLGIEYGGSSWRGALAKLRNLELVPRGGFGLAPEIFA